MTLRITSAFSAMALTVAVLAGCAATPPGLSGEASSSLQAGVVAVAESAAAGDSAGALTRLDELEQTLDAALAAGEVTDERAADIQEALDTVRADLQPASTPTPTPTAEPAPSITVDPVVPDDGGGDDGGGNDGGGSDGGGDDNSGPGNNNGNDDNGNGNGKG